ncbi:Phospholipid-transporting ATPase 2 [Nymphaea thermarum]|nr:Phospholipid-transporting ATPase 2 [Nymphaea thermarum]
MHSFSFISGVSGTSLFNSFSLMAYNVFYTSIPVMVNVLDKDLSVKTVMQHPQILFYCQAGRLLNPSTFAGWFGRSLFHALVVFIISIHVYADDKREMEELSMVAFSGCIWLQAFVVTMETKQPSYWFAMLLIVVSGMGPVLALKYFRYTYRSSAINILQQAEYSRSRTSALANIEHPLRVIDKEVSPLSTPQSKSRASVYEPLLHDSPSAARRSLGSSTAFELFQSPSRLSSSYSRNCKDN